jgi:glycosyltransferase involved in cell wall biosynthesis
LTTPLVSICCQTYNHLNYIEKCIEGFLIQKTTFKFEILIIDDASTDGTSDIINKYFIQYPNLIFPIINSENRFSKGISQFNINKNRAKGKYLAICEGDDYWIDPLKIQKQVDFLENNNDYGLVYTNYIMLTSNNVESIKSKKFSGNVFDKLIMSNFIGTLTVCFRKNLLDKVDGLKIYDQNFKMGDYPLWLAFSYITKFKYIDDITSVYRISPNTLSNQLNCVDRFNFEDSVFDIRYFFLKKYEEKNKNKRKIENLYLFFLIRSKIRYTHILNNTHFKCSIYFIFKFSIFFILHSFLRSKASRLLFRFPY